MGVFAAWERYEAWNQAFSRVLFGPNNEGQPVYLDMDDDILEQVAAEAGVDQSDVSSRLVAAVRETLYMDTADGAVFDRHLYKLRQWRRAMRVFLARGQEPEPPPVIALLAVLTLAAEEMQYDSEFAAGAYYPRLFRLLDLPVRQRSRARAAYQKHAEELWRALNEWLAAADGRFGLPTAYALSKRYVGLPLSQALVREADRREFPNMFRRFGLMPGSEISPADMEQLFGSWLETRPCPVSRALEALWRRGDARERIASIAAGELHNWDGTGGAVGTAGADSVHRTGDIQLLAWTRRFPRPQLDVTFLARIDAQPGPDTLTVLTAEGQPGIEVVPAPGARLQPALASRIDGASLIEGMLKLRDESSGQVVTRPPRRVVPFRHDDLLNAYVECERVQLCENSAVLVKDDRMLLPAVRDLLNETARPGFREEGELPGLPQGWALFTGVQVLATPASEPKGLDLNALVPLLSSQLTIAGGTRLPGRLRKWSSLDPPEVRAAVQTAAEISVVLTALNDDNYVPVLPYTWSSPDGALVADLGTLDLPDGDYELVLKDGKKTLQQTVLRLRSSDTPDLNSSRQATPLAHILNVDPLAVFRAAAIPDGWPARDLVRGPAAPASTRAAAPATMASGGSKIWWAAPRPPAVHTQPAISLAQPEVTSCVVTGAHHIDLPAYDGHARWGLVDGTCRDCGLVKRYPARIPWWRLRGGGALRTEREIPPHVNVSELPKVTDGHAGWDVALDCLIHARGGSYSALEHVARQVEGSGLFSDSFTKSLEARGDLEVRRGDDLAPCEWEFTPMYLAGLATGEFLLTGGWSGHARQKLERLVKKAGGTFKTGRDDGGPTRYTVAGLRTGDLERIAEAVGSVGVIPDAATRIVRALPPLSAVEAALPRTAMPGARRIQRFHVQSASWTPVAIATQPGGYRLESAFTMTDVYRTKEDTERNEVALSTVHLSKHLAARHYGRALMAYAPGRKFLAVPLGADLPGLYGRAVVLCSGRLPTRHPKDRMLLYRDVPQGVADVLARLLMS